MTVISKDCVVTLNYRLRSEKDETLDSSDQAGPIVYIQGAEDILQGIENAVEGLSINDEVSITIAAADAYGEYEPEKVETVPRSAFVGMDDIQVGMQVQEETEHGPMQITIKEVTDDQVVVDANHPLAGQSLHFDLQVKAIRMATPEELDHGHVHGEHGHNH